MRTPLRIAVLLSGNGSTLQNLLDHVTNGRLNARVVAVVSSNSDAYGLTRAADAGVPTAVIERKSRADVADFSRAIFDRCRAARADLVCMAGFVQFVEIPPDFSNRVMNVHPSLIPAFCGKGFYGGRVHQSVLNAGVKITGCTIHFADNEYDHGPIILQRAVPVHEDDTAATLAARVGEAEREAYPEAVRLFAEDRLQVDEQRVRILDSAS